MKRHLVLIISILTIATVFISSTTTMYSSSVIEKIRLTDKEIPDGYMYGQIPKFAQGLLKNNPWNLDQAAIKKLTHRIYPGGEPGKVSDLHMTIITNKKKPYGDDIVCYIFIFKNEKAAREELAKLKEFVGYNSDRSILLEKNNLVVYLFVDNVKEFEHIKTLSENIKSRLEAL